jgi:large subunit ribosomal protein L22
MDKQTYKAQLNNLRLSPQKVGLVAAYVRGMKATEAITHLKFINKRAAQPIAKLIESAVANAKNNFGAVTDNLVVEKIFVTKAVDYKRGRAVSRGRYFKIIKKGSNITLELASK